MAEKRRDTSNTNYTKSQLDTIIADIQTQNEVKVGQLKAVIDDLNKEIINKDSVIRDLNSDIQKYKANSMLGTEESEAIKKILMYYAKGFTYKSIFDKMKFFNYEGNIDFIKYICQNVEELDNELLNYYKKQVQEYEESIKINPDLINNTLIQVLQQNINDASQDLEGLTDIKEKSNLRAEITKHAKELTLLTKNVADIKEEEEFNSQITKIKESLNSRSERIIKNFDPTKLKVVK